MEKTAFFEEIADIFEFDVEVNEKTLIAVDSLALLSLIAFFDENFEHQLTAADVKDVSIVSDLMDIAGLEKFS